MLKKSKERFKMLTFNAIVEVKKLTLEKQNPHRARLGGSALKAKDFLHINYILFSCPALSRLSSDNVFLSEVSL